MGEPKKTLLVSYYPVIQRIPAASSRATDQFPDFNKWAEMDIMFAIIVANLPTLNSLIPKKWLGSQKGSKVSSHQMGSQSPDHVASKEEESAIHIENVNDEEVSLSSRTESTMVSSGPRKIRIQPDYDDYHANIKSHP